MSHHRIGSMELEGPFSLESLRLSAKEPIDDRNHTVTNVPEFPKISDCRFKCVAGHVSANEENSVLEHRNNSSGEKSPTPSETFTEGEEEDGDMFYEKRGITESRFNDMSIQDIVQEVMTLEDRIDSIQKILKESKYVPNPPEVEEEQREKIKGFTIAIQQTAEENAKLRLKNKLLEQRLLQVRRTSFC